jgi:flagellar hook-basal body complex protein FliE
VSTIAHITPAAIAPIESGTSAKPAQKADLGDAFADALKEAHTHETEATSTAERFANGDPSMGIHEVMIASEKANIAIRYATTLKNKALEAYRELMNTQV